MNRHRSQPRIRLAFTTSVSLAIAFTMWVRAQEAPTQPAREETPARTSTVTTIPASHLRVSRDDAGEWVVLTDSGPVEPNPREAWKALLATAKASEEGDADLATAAGLYTAVIRIFMELRPIAADTLHRYASIEERRQHGNEASAARARLLQWFPDFPQYAQTPPAPGPTPAGATPLDATGNPTRTPTVYHMSPELMRRYGLIPTKGPVPTPDIAPGAAGDQHAALVARYGLGVPSENSTATPGTPRSQEPQEVVANPGQSGANRKDSERALYIRRRVEILTELGRLKSEISKAQREVSNVADLPPSEIPPTLVADPRFRRLLEDATDPIKPPNLTDGEFSRLRSSREHTLENYFRSVYLPRLQRTAKILEADLEALRAELHEVDKLLEEHGRLF